MPRILTPEQKERAKARSAAWYAANRERKLAADKEWAAKNPDKRRAIVRRWKAKSGDKHLETARIYKRRWHADNPEESRLRSKSWRDRNKPLVAAMKRKATYKLDEGEYQELLKSCSGCCFICAEIPSGKRHHGVLHVDHDHQTGAVRGLLCARCNAALGLLRDNASLCRQAADYLHRGGGHRNAAGFEGQAP